MGDSNTAVVSVAQHQVVLLPLRVIPNEHEIFQESREKKIAC